MAAREGSVEVAVDEEIWISFPCVSMRATGNALKMVSSSAGRRDLARAKTLSTAGDEAVCRDQLY